MNAYLSKELDELKLECAAPNWDGYSACALSDDSMNHAMAIAECIPDDLVAPSVSVDSNGRVYFTWGNVRSKFLTATFVPDVVGKVECTIGQNGRVESQGVSLDAEDLFRKAKAVL